MMNFWVSFLDILKTPTSYVTYGWLQWAAVFVVAFFALLLSFSKINNIIIHQILKFSMTVILLVVLALSCVMYGAYPFHICHMSAWLVIPGALLFNNTICKYIAVYITMWTALVALVLPELAFHVILIKYVVYFMMHGLLVLAPIYILKYQTPTLNFRSVLLTFLFFNVYLLGVGLLDYVFNQNYAYLVSPPEVIVQLPIFIPWPGYIIEAELIVFSLIMLMFAGNQLYRYLSNKKKKIISFFFFCGQMIKIILKKNALKVSKSDT